ncbi:MAG: glycosyltransferase family 2 protein [Deltaproteobacteria bacterium]|nr:glycosyltransferase family 2 protein [Deltaproteobacteria bacterium]
MLTLPQKILVIIPAHNEKTRVGKVVRAVKRVLSQATVLVIDDCSVDGTRQESLDAHAIVLSHAVNLGYGAALGSGYLFFEKEGYDILLQMDGDGQHLAEEIPKLLGPIQAGAADVVIGSRYAEGCGPSRTNVVKRWGQQLLSAIFFLATRQRITDPTSGFQCLGKKAVEFYTRARYPHDYPDVDVLIMASYAGLTIREVPVMMAERAEGVSMHSGLQPLYYLVKMILSSFVVILSCREWKKCHPDR